MNVSIKPRRHVGGMLCVNKERVYADRVLWLVWFRWLNSLQSYAKQSHNWNKTETKVM